VSLSRTLKLIYTATTQTAWTVLSCLVWWCELSRPDRQTGAFFVWSVSECVGRRSATAGRTPTQNALARRSIHTATPDKTVAPACRPPPRRRQLRLAARPPTRSDVLRHAKCKHVVKCCILLNLNFFTKRQATTLVLRLTVQTLPDGLETRFTPPDTTQTALSCRVWRAV